MLDFLILISDQTCFKGLGDCMLVKILKDYSVS